MTSLANAIGEATGVLPLDGLLDVGSYPAPYTIDSEYVLIVGGDISTTPTALRGQNGSAPTTHDAGAELVLGWGSGSSQTLEQTLELGNDTGDNLIVVPNGVIDGAHGHQIQVSASPDANAGGAGFVLYVGGVQTGTDGGLAQIAGGQGANGPGGAGAVFNGGDADGGSVELTAGTAGGPDLSNGGDITLTVSGGFTGGRHGQIILSGLPTADPHVVGALYSTAGILHVSAG